MRLSKGLCVASLFVIVACGADALAQPAGPTGTAAEKPRELERLERYDEYKKMLEEVLKQVGALTIQVEPAGAEVLIDGQSKGKAPLEERSFVDPGKHTIEVKLDGYKAAQVVVDMAAGSSKDILIVLGQEERPSSDGAPPSAQPGATGGVEPKKEDWPPPGIPPIVIGGLVATGAFYATSIGFLVAYENQRADYSALASGKAFADLAITTALLGTALGVSTTIYSMTIPFSRPESATYIVPMASVNGGGVMLAGRW